VVVEQRKAAKMLFVQQSASGIGLGSLRYVLRQHSLFSMTAYCEVVQLLVATRCGPASLPFRLQLFE
jgi:hypothetical protein